MPGAREIKRQHIMKQWATIIADRNASGLKVDDYCKKNHLSRNSYFYWLRQLRETMSASVPCDDSTQQVPVGVSSELVEIVSSTGNNTIPVKSISQISLLEDNVETLEIIINGVIIPVKSTTSDELLIKIMRAARNA